MNYENRLPTGEILGGASTFEEAIRLARELRVKLDVPMVTTFRVSDGAELATAAPSGGLDSLHRRRLEPRIRRHHTTEQIHPNALAIAFDEAI